MASENDARLQFLTHEVQEWEKFFETKQWRTIVQRGQALSDVLQNKLINMDVRDISGVIDLLDTRARLKGVLANSLVPNEIVMELEDEIQRLHKGEE